MAWGGSDIENCGNRLFSIVLDTERMVRSQSGCSGICLFIAGHTIVRGFGEA
jgi:hypothetical protein